MSGSDSLVARMKEYLPEFVGYRGRENRVASEKIAREAWAKELRFSSNVLAEHLKNSSKIGDSKKQVADTVIRKLNSIVESSKQLSVDTTFFTATELTENDIEFILTVDLNLQTRSTAIKQKAIRTSREVASSPAWDREIDELYNKIKDFDQTWKKRERMMSEIKI